MSKRKISTKKVVAAIIWLMMGTGLLVVLVAAIRRTNDASCNGVELTITGAEQYSFLEDRDVLAIIGAKGKKAFKGKPVADFDLSRMEAELSRNSWVGEAELYFDKDRVLQVKVREREPMVRIFTGSGRSWYLDSAGKYLPLAPGKPPVKLPVFTGLPEKLNPRRSADSALLAGLKSITRVLEQDPFWKAQITQVDLGPEREFELVPLVGHHRILFGDGNEVEKKFRKLAVFYREVLARTGFDHYSTINLKYDREVVATKGNPISTGVDKKMMISSPATAPLLITSVQTPAETPSILSQPDRKTGQQPKALMKKLNN